jgi:hypothetical protein
MRWIRLLVHGERGLMAGQIEPGRTADDGRAEMLPRRIRGLLDTAGLSRPLAEVEPVPSSGGFNPAVPNVARIYDCLLGGKNNFDADRQAARELVQAVPRAAAAARANRGFLRRAVRYLAQEAGIRQFLDIGTGLPTAGNVHEIAHDVDPKARVVYVDNDPVVITHANALLATDPAVTAFYSDLLLPRHLLGTLAVRSLLGLNEPVAVLMVAVLHFIQDHQDPWAIVEEFTSAMAPGSYLVLSHVTGDDIPQSAQRQAASVYTHASAPGTARTHAQVARFFDGLTMLDPGLVNVTDWRPVLEHRKRRPVLFYGGIGRKPSTAPQDQR